MTTPPDRPVDGTTGERRPVTGPRLLALTVGDAPEAWRSAGFGVDDDGSTVIDGVTVRLVGGAERGVRSWTLAGSGPDDGAGGSRDRARPGGTSPARDDGILNDRTPDDRTLDGIPTTTGRDPGDDGGPDPIVHPNGVVGLDHVVVRTPDLDRTLGRLARWGFEARRVRDVPGAEPPRRQVFLWAGDVIVELVGPAEARADGGPASIWGLALVTDDLDRCAEVLGPLVSKPRDAVQPGRRIASIRTNELDISVPLAVMSPHLRP